MEPVYGQILQKGYGLRLQRAIRSRTGVICYTDRGVKELKKTFADDSRLAFDHAARERLYQAGFPQVLRYRPTIEGESSFRWNDTRYVLEDYIPVIEEGDSPVFLREAASTLASMHTASAGLFVPAEHTGLEKLPVTFLKRQRELGRFRKWIKNQSEYSKVDLLVLQNFEIYKNRIAAALSLLEGADYGGLCRRAKEEGTFCHNAYKGDNLRRDQNGVLRVTGFEKAAYDLWVVDLADFLRRYLRRPGADPAFLPELLTAYQAVRPLSAGEREMLLALLTYPYRFLKLINGYYNKRRVYVSDAMVQKLTECVEGQAQEDAALAGLRKILL